MKQRRTRGKKPVVPLGLATLESWQSDPSLIRWAQTDPTFRMAVTVLINERIRVHDYLMNEPLTENCRLGRVQGYEKAIEIMKELAMGKPQPPPDMGQPTYQSVENLREQITD
jgi:hypothetical protein